MFDDRKIMVHCKGEVAFAAAQVHNFQRPASGKAAGHVVDQLQKPVDLLEFIPHPGDDPSFPVHDAQLLQKGDGLVVRQKAGFVPVVFLEGGRVGFPDVVVDEKALFPHLHLAIPAGGENVALAEILFQLPAEEGGCLLWGKVLMQGLVVRWVAGQLDHGLPVLGEKMDLQPEDSPIPWAAEYHFFKVWPEITWVNISWTG